MRFNPPLSDHRVRGTLKAFKAARLVTDVAGGVNFSGAGLGGRYGSADIATCIVESEHVPPHPGCACGWYAFKRRSDAVSLLTADCPALLEVELWGSFHEYELGYVAGVQRVHRVTLQPYCLRCLAGRDSKTRPAVALTHDQARKRPELVPACDEHTRRTDRVVTLLELADCLRVEARWAPDADEITGVIKTLALSLRPLLRRQVRVLDELCPGEVAYVFQNAIAEDPDGSLFIDPMARLVQPLPGTDVPIRLTQAGGHEVLLDELDDFRGWQRRADPTKYILPITTHDRSKPAPTTDDPRAA